MMKKIRIFVATPADACPECECLESVIYELNQPGKFAHQMGVELKIYDWGASLADFKKRKAGLNFDELPLKQWDLFVGVLRFGFDEPAEERFQDNERRHPPITGDVFDYAYRAWKRTGTPELLLYRSHRVFSPTKVNQRQLRKVQECFEKYIVDTLKPTPYKIFKDTDTFKEILKRDLLNYLEKFQRYMLLSKELNMAGGEICQGETPGKRLKEDQTVDMVLLRINSLIFNPQVKDQPIEKVKLLLKNHFDFAVSIISKYKGEQIAWDVEGGVWAFQGESSYDRAVAAGIGLTSKQGEFNGDRTLNPFEAHLKPRMFAHCSSVKVGQSTDRPYNLLRNYVTHMEKSNTPPGAFVVTDILYQKLSANLKKELNYEGDYEHHALYSYFHPSEEPDTEPLSDIELESIRIKIEDNIEVLSERLKIAVLPQSGEPDYEEMRGYAERIYESYESFYHRASKHDSKWLEEYFLKLRNFINLILNDDERLRQRLEDLTVDLKRNGIERPVLLSIQHFIASLRINPLSNIALLARQLKKRLAKEIDMGTFLAEYLQEKLIDFVNSDDFHEETAFAELFMTQELKERLRIFIANQYNDPFYGELISRLWELADFVCIEDKIAEKGQKIFPTLVKEQGGIEYKKTKYFRVTHKLLSEDSPLDREVVKNQFNHFQINPDKKDINVLLKCIFIEHPRVEIRKFILASIEFSTLWSIISYSKTPLAVLTEIAEELLRSHDADRMKVFFSLTHPRLTFITLENLHLTTLSKLKRMIEIFYKFNFFVEDRYFKRLYDLTMKFKKKARKDDLQVIENASKRLERNIVEKGNIPEISPKCLAELPLAVQRKLARSGEYLEFFCSSTNNFVAGEVYRYVHHNNIEHFLHIIGINETLLSKLLHKTSLFIKRSAIYAALCHPKCNVEFASRYAAKLSYAQQKNIGCNPNANSGVKNYINNRFQIKIYR
jgi:hypothetical protein